MRNDPADSSDLDVLDRSLLRTRVVSTDAEGEERVDREQWEALSRRLGFDGLARIADRHLRSKKILQTSDGAERRTRWLGIPLLRRTPIMPMLGAAALMIAIPMLWKIGREPRSIVTSHTYVARRAQRTVATLDDGSNVVLAPETRIRYTVDNAGIRSLDLVGEALFTVHDTRRPFVVRTGAVTTRVLGTTFDVRRYRGDAATQVTVISGRVVAGGRTSPIVLAAGMMGHITDSTTTVNPISEPVRAVVWTQDRLIFNDTPVPEMLTTLGRWYGYEFRLADTTLVTHHVSVALSTDKLAEAMRTIKALLRVTMTYDGNVVTLRPESDGRDTVHGKSIRELLRHPEPEVGK